MTDTLIDVIDAGRCPRIVITLDSSGTYFTVRQYGETDGHNPSPILRSVLKINNVRDAIRFADKWEKEGYRR